MFQSRTHFLYICHETAIKNLKLETNAPLLEKIKIHSNSATATTTRNNYMRDFSSAIAKNKHVFYAFSY